MFSPVERESNPAIRSPNKAVEALRRVLLQPPKMLGFVLPRSFIDGQMYRKVRKQIAELYDQVSLLVLPDNAFHFSDVETVLLSAYGIRTAHPVWYSALVKKTDYQQFVYTGEPTWQAQASATFVEEQSKVTSPILWYTPMQPVWDALAELPRLGNIAEVHRGIEYNIPFEENKAKLISNISLDGFAQGLHERSSIEPFTVKNLFYLNVSPEKQRGGAYKLPWKTPKIIANAVRLSRGAWTIAAAIDDLGLVCYQNLHGIWPTGNVPLEVIAAVLNGPVANAFLSTHSTTQHNKAETIENMPFPKFNPAQAHRIASLVREYMSYRAQWKAQPEYAEYFEGRCRGIMKRLDGEILMAYNLPLQLEQKLIQYFDGAHRPGPVTLTEVKPSPTKRLYNSIIKIVDIRDEDDKKVLEVALMNWNPHQTVDLPVSLIPQELRAALDRDVLLLAKVNVGASEANELFFEDFRLPPEVETTW